MFRGDGSRAQKLENRWNCLNSFVRGCSSTFEIDAARRRFVTEIAPKAPFLSMNRGPNGMVFELAQELFSTV